MGAEGLGRALRNGARCDAIATHGVLSVGHLGDERAVHDESAARIMQVVETESSLLRLDVDRQPWRGQKVVESTMSATEVGLAAMGKAEVRVLDCIGTLRPRAASEHEDEACGGGPRRHLGGPPAPQQHTQATHPSELRHVSNFRQFDGTRAPVGITILLEHLNPWCAPCLVCPFYFFYLRTVFFAVSAAGYGGIWRDMAGYREIPGDTGRYQEIRDTGGYGRIRADTGRYGEIRGDTGRSYLIFPPGPFLRFAGIAKSDTNICPSQQSSSASAAQ